MRIFGSVRCWGERARGRGALQTLPGQRTGERAQARSTKAGCWSWRGSSARISIDTHAPNRNAVHLYRMMALRVTLYICQSKRTDVKRVCLAERAERRRACARDDSGVAAGRDRGSADDLSERGIETPGAIIVSPRHPLMMRRGWQMRVCEHNSWNGVTRRARDRAVCLVWPWRNYLSWAVNIASVRATIANI